ncbi:NAD(P)/FAD-dependent oxidoreductase [Paenibacillus sp. BC26]|uniref:dihydrolipoyl dehydrogenase family protein n=1 Tax=Paenibacillus sp. BC26 TaxID=1881032 RepID=UPI0008E45EF1|nr:FAD-dependent oxidoreductase [Paenibacillus sp. BC26]SFT13283.1 Pyruvate/2-oxoglutarate dehydrogenase complex, dihydrolipoamide dehydrogenase (E3) component [Paenibacillus sp. BC26]
MKSYDLIVIGGGSGGLTAAAGAVHLGAKVALIEKEPEPGGDCLHTGCVPSKALIAAAKELHTAKKAAEAYGLKLVGEADYLEAYRRVQTAKATIQHHDSTERFRSMGVDVFHGHGQFRDKHHIEIDGGEVLYGKRIVIATGSRASVPPIAGLDDVDFLTNESVFDRGALPKSLVVIGAGPVGLELSQALARLGAKVTVLVRGSRILSKEDKDLIPYAQKALDKEMSFLFNTSVSKVEAMPDGRKRLLLERNGEQHQLETDAIFIATGRRPNTDRLGLSDIGIQMDHEHIAVGNTLQTNIPHIYAVGDVIKPFPFTHVAGMEGKIVVANAVLGLKRRVSYDHVPWVTYTDPEIFHLGMTEDEARNKVGDDIRIYKVTLDQVDRFITDQNTEGIVKVITDAKGRILGAHAAGNGAGDWMQQAVFAKRFGHKLPDISQVVHPYPSRSEALLRTADHYWRDRLFQGGIAGRLIKAYVKWFR